MKFRLFKDRKARDENYKSFIASRMINFLILSNSNVPDSLKGDLNDEIEYYRKMVKK